MADINDPLPLINIPRAIGWSAGFEITKWMWNLTNVWYNPGDVHTSYFATGDRRTDKSGMTNLAKTVKKAIGYFK
jgi:hypothetical protein